MINQDLTGLKSVFSRLEHGEVKILWVHKKRKVYSLVSENENLGELHIKKARIVINEDIKDYIVKAGRDCVTIVTRKRAFKKWFDVL